MNLHRGFGVELEGVTFKARVEIQVYLNQMGLAGQWEVVSDGSVHSQRLGEDSFEVKSPILYLDDPAQMQDLKNVMKYLRSIGRVNSTCGTHVHVDARNFDFKDLINLSKLYARYEHIFVGLLPKERCYPNSRRNYCKPWSESLELNVDDLCQVETKEEFRRIWNHSSSHSGNSRYRNLNYIPWVQQGSVEFRGHQGTLSFTKFLPWINLCVSLVSFSKEVRVGRVSSLKMKSIYHKCLHRKDWNYWKQDFYKLANKLALGSSLREYLLKRAIKYWFVGVRI